MNNGTYAFLFDADFPGFHGYYGLPCDTCLFTAVMECTDLSMINSRIFSGDVLIFETCQKIAKVSKKDERYGTISITYKINKDLYITIITYLCKSIYKRKNSIKQDLIRLFAKHNTYCNVVSNLEISKYQLIDEKISDFPGYIGSFEVDLGNPLHTLVFKDYLKYVGFLNKNFFYIQKEILPDEQFIPGWTQKNKKIKIKILDSQEFHKIEPELLMPEEYSDDGKVIQKILVEKNNNDHYQKIALGLINNQNKNEFDYSINQEFSFSKIVISPEKLTDYCLNFDHQDGKNKAKLFSDLLGITKEDWRFLAAQIYNGINDGELKKVRKTNFGIQYHIDIPIIGKNGVTKNVRTAWITIDNEIINLVSAYIPDKSNNDKIGEKPLIVDKNCKDTYWETLYEYAKKEGELMSKNIIPTPMFIEGYSEPILDGSIGYAYIIIKDARKKFVKWLKNNHIGSKYYKTGWLISADYSGSSYKRAKAYAEGFEKILKQNGIECYSISNLD